MSLHLLSLLKSATSERHHKAVQGLQNGSLTVSINHRTDRTIRATVCSGEHTYGVHLGDFGSVCDCADFAWRGSVPCKHAIAVAVFALQPPSVRASVPTLSTPITEKTHLQYSNGVLLCSESLPLKVWRWPWPMGIVHHQEHWPEVQLCQACVQTSQQPTTAPAAWKEAA